MDLTAQAIKRLPYYLQHLRFLREKGVETISAASIASALKLNEVQVRKDIALVSSCKGKPRVGFPVNNLISDIEACLGYNRLNTAILIGAGCMGQALLINTAFPKYGLDIKAAFDINSDIVGSTICDKHIYPLEYLEEYCDKNEIQIGIITSPANTAQDICDRLLACGIKAIWNFALLTLDVPEDILVYNENLVGTLGFFSQYFKEDNTNRENRS